jgi:hypothetical protein
LYYWDIYGLLWACVAGSWTILIINAYLTSKYVRYDLKEQFMDLLPIILLSIVSYIISEMTLYFIDVDVILKSFIRGGIFSISYIVIAHILKIEAYTQIKSLLFEYVKKK